MSDLSKSVKGHQATVFGSVKLLKIRPQNRQLGSQPATLQP
jgi:hypothetical protein